MFPLPSLSLYCSLCSLWARPGRLMLYLAPGGKVSALFWSLSLPPTTSTPLLNPHRGRSLALGPPSPPRITRLHPPNAEQEGRQSCGMRVQRGACQILCPFDFFHIASLDHVEAFKHKQAAPQRVQQSTVNMLHPHTHTHTSTAPHMQHPRSVFYLPHSATCTHQHARSAHSSTDPTDYRVFVCVCPYCSSQLVQ